MRYKTSYLYHITAVVVILDSACLKMLMMPLKYRHMTHARVWSDRKHFCLFKALKYFFSQ